ncbi:hypothetical protein MKW98_019802 [Papaver atlanticum]|uniref:PGG domain-containing protein n=1 Tax=Papaver atlanticum TaxID=357466 RepID=A0AAD4TCY2_9MAGN|nr:hypothetical protein MKW98_019802 [Papaver atlanticum]
MTAGDLGGNPRRKSKASLHDSSNGEDRDRQLHETIVLSTKQIVASIEASNARVEASNAGIQALLCKIELLKLDNNRQLVEDVLLPLKYTRKIAQACVKGGQVKEEDEQWKFLEEIVKLVPPVTLEHVNPQYDGTILHFAAILGNIKAVKVLVEKNSNLKQIRGSREPYHVPLLMAAVNATDGEKKVVEYLCSVTRDEDPSPFSGLCGLTLVTSLILSEMCGLALSVCKRFPRLVNDQHGPELIFSSLITIAGRPFAFLSGSKLKWWERCIYSFSKIIRERSLTSNAGSITNYISLYIMHYIIQVLKLLVFIFISVPCIKQLYTQKLMHKHVVSLVAYFIGHLSKAYNTTAITNLFLKSNILGIAIKFGTTEFVLECLRVFPHLCLFEGAHTIVGLVIRERNEMIYNFIYILRQSAKLDGHPIPYKNNNTILHFSAELAHNRQLNCVSGAAFQMQREIQCFKGVENTMPQKERFIRNSDGDTAHFLFTVKHRDLMEKGEKWMKETSSSCMVVAALIATVAFAAAITVSGGNISDNTSKKNGIPVFLDRKSFMVFAVTDALALFSSSRQ